jgi:hypothetical protein
MKIENRDGVDLSKLANSVIMLRGDRNKYHVTVRDPSGLSTKEFKHMIFNPCIQFGRSYNELSVKYNTIHTPFNGFVVESIPSMGDPLNRQNALNLILNEWVLLTFVFQDHHPINDFEDGIDARVYLNDALYQHHQSKGAFRVNQGDLCLFPTNDGIHSTAAGLVHIGDLTYCNFAMTESDVRKAYERGPPTKSFRDMESDSLSDPLYLTEYNKLDIYNT